MSEEQTERRRQRTSAPALVLEAKGADLKAPPCAGWPLISFRNPPKARRGPN